MLMFCPSCGNLLGVEEGVCNYRFSCPTCPYIQTITSKISSKSYSKNLKELDDVLGGKRRVGKRGSYGRNLPKVLA